MNRLQVVSVGWLALFWMLAWGEFSLGMFVFGLVVGAGVLVAFPMPRLTTPVTLRPAATAWLLVRFLADLVRASLQVAALTLRPRPITPGAVTRVRLRSDNELLRAVTASLVGLVPGTVVTGLAPDGHLELHALDVNDTTGMARVHTDVLHQEERVRLALEPGYRSGGTA